MRYYRCIDAATRRSPGLFSAGPFSARMLYYLYRVSDYPGGGVLITPNPLSRHHEHCLQCLAKPLEIHSLRALRESAQGKDDVIFPHSEMFDRVVAGVPEFRTVPERRESGCSRQQFYDHHHIIVQHYSLAFNQIVMNDGFITSSVGR